MQYYYIAWWVLSGVCVAIEMMTGTLYLLMIALSAGVGALVAHMGFDLAAQLIASAVFGIIATSFMHRKKMSSIAKEKEDRKGFDNRDMLLDVNSTIWVAEQEIETIKTSGQALITYRGALWQFRIEGGGDFKPGNHSIKSIDQNVLILSSVN